MNFIRFSELETTISRIANAIWLFRNNRKRKPGFVFTNKKDIEYFLYNYGKRGYVGDMIHINKFHGGLTVSGSFYLNEAFSASNFTELPLKLDHVFGNFGLVNCHNLRTLINCPSYVRGTFYLHRCNGLTSLHGAPTEVQSFSCLQCENLTTLQGGPRKVTWGYTCCGCPQLQSLAYGPEEGRSLRAENCPKVSKLSDCKTIPAILEIVNTAITEAALMQAPCVNVIKEIQTSFETVSADLFRWAYHHHIILRLQTFDRELQDYLTLGKYDILDLAAWFKQRYNEDLYASTSQPAPSPIPEL